MKIVCIGRNYADHISELANQRPTDPVIFMKPDTALLPDEQAFVIPEFTNNVHHEVELVIKISKNGKHISPDFVGGYYEEIGLGIDFTARDVQDKLKEKGLPWEKAKAFDGSAVVGRFFSKSIYSDVNNLNFLLKKNGVDVQKGNSSLMLWKIDELIAYVSTFFTLRKGDLLFTGTPAGVGKIVSGDLLEGYIEKERVFKTQIL